MLHIRCGTDIVEKLRASGLPGDILVWQDPVSHGPTPAEWTGDEWYAGRAAFIAEAYGCEAPVIDQELREADSALDHMADHDEVVLWLEHDLFDQSILLRLLTLIEARDRGNAALSLVSIASHPEIPRFIGLGNLDARQLAALFPGRRPITDAMIATASRIWRNYVSPDPRAIAEDARHPVEGFPWLAAALARHLEELPWVTDGLNRTERQALHALENGASTPGAAFIAAQDVEEAPWQGDSMFYHVLAGMSACTPPLVTVDSQWPDDAFASARSTITSAGVAALHGRLATRTDGSERWVGGVRLDAAGNGWRWNPLSRMPERG